tara:strand:- start:343 stop:876 length:534 start_codon:yes stop_codon:yes gene_type:complete
MRIYGSDYAGGGILPAYGNPIAPTRPVTKQLPSPEPTPTPTYNSVQAVVQAYKEGNLSYMQAYNILVNQFGMSDGDATDILTVELDVSGYTRPDGTYVPPIGPEQLPGDFDGDGIPNEFDPDHYVIEEEQQEEQESGLDDDRPKFGDNMFVLTDNQKFLLIGALVIGIGSRMIIKRD